MDRLEIIRSMIRKTKAKTYLEIGTSAGAVFFGVKAIRKIGIDPMMPPYLSGKNRFRVLVRRIRMFLRGEQFFCMTSDGFFSRKRSVLQHCGIDLAFMDGLHTYQQARADVLHCLEHLNPGGVIVMHDCNPLSEAMGFPARSPMDVKRLKLPGWTGEWCGDVWKTVVYLRSLRRDLEVFVLDADHGVGVIRRGKPVSSLSLTEQQIEEMPYDFFASHRQELLDLKDPKFLREWLGQNHG